MSKKYKLLILISSILILFGMGFIAGRKSVKIREHTIIEYLPSEPIHDSVPKPYYVDKYIKVDTANLFSYCLTHHLYDYLLPVIIKDSITYLEVDTMKILAKFFEYRKYDIELFNIDTLGRVEVFPEVQYNELTGLSYTFYPMQKVVTSVKEKEYKFTPFLGGGLGLSNSAIVQLGLFTQNGFGFSGYYQRSFAQKSNDYGLMILYKF